MLYLMGLREPLGEIGSGPPYSVGNGEVVDLGSRRDMARNVGRERGAVGVWGLLTGPGCVGRHSRSRRPWFAGALPLGRRVFC